MAKDFYQIPTRNKHGEIEVLMLLKDNVSSVNKITDTAFEEEFVSHKKPKLQDAPIDQRTKQELEQLLERNKDCFAEDKRQIGTTPLITMSDECQTGFEYLGTCLTKSPILKYPDPHKRYVVFTDASDQAAAVVLTQEYIGDDGQMKEMPVAYLSAQFNDTQFKWSSVVKEGYAIYHAIKKWRHCLEDAEVLLKSDAKSLQKFLNGKTDNLKLDRWSLELQGRNIEVEHILGYKNKAADCLS